MKFNLRRLLTLLLILSITIAVVVFVAHLQIKEIDDQSQMEVEQEEGLTIKEELYKSTAFMSSKVGKESIRKLKESFTDDFIYFDPMDSEPLDTKLVYVKCLSSNYGTFVATFVMSTGELVSTTYETTKLAFEVKEQGTKLIPDAEWSIDTSGVFASSLRDSTVNATLSIFLRDWDLEWELQAITSLRSYLSEFEINIKEIIIAKSSTLGTDKDYLIDIKLTDKQ